MPDEMVFRHLVRHRWGKRWPDGPSMTERKLAVHREEHYTIGRPGLAKRIKRFLTEHPRFLQEYPPT
jgi:hypothetical protein